MIGGNFKSLCPYPCPNREPGCRGKCPTGIEDTKRMEDYTNTVKNARKADAIYHAYQKDCAIERLNRRHPTANERRRKTV